MSLHGRILDVLKLRWQVVYSHLPLALLCVLVTLALINWQVWNLKALALTLSVGAGLVNVVVVYQVIRVKRMLATPAWREIQQGFLLLLCMSGVSIYLQAVRPPGNMTIASLVFQALWCCKALKHLNGFMTLEHDLRSWRTVVKLRRAQREQAAAAISMPSPATLSGAELRAVDGAVERGEAEDGADTDKH